MLYTTTFSPTSASPSSCVSLHNFRCCSHTPLNRSLSLSLFLFIYYFGAKQTNRPLANRFVQILLKQLIRGIRAGRLPSRDRWPCCPRWHACRRVSLAPRPNPHIHPPHTEWISHVDREGTQPRNMIAKPAILLPALQRKDQHHSTEQETGYTTSPNSKFRTLNSPTKPNTLLHNTMQARHPASQPTDHPKEPYPSRTAAL